MPELYKLELTKEELLALREAVGQIDDHSNWMVDVFEHGEHLEGVYKKVYELANPVIREINESS